MRRTTQSAVNLGEQNENPSRLGLNDRLGLIGLIDEGMRRGSGESPVAADLFRNLWDLVEKTISGARIDPLKPNGKSNGFRALEINSSEGENLGRLNLLYLKKPIPCYYLVYVEVAPPFRRKGLGRLVLEHFREFLKDKGALGILDNIIPQDDPTYEIYTKQAWEPLEAILGERTPGDAGNIMVYVPSRFQDRDLTEPLQRLIHHLSRKRAAIDMRDNEEMVKRTITEFRDLYAALRIYFEKELDEGRATPLMRFMFTRFVTKLIGFRRRIGRLIGYTGGDSMEQFVLDPAVLALKSKSYAPPELASGTNLVFGDRALALKLPEELKKHPARIIESLPNYARPSLNAWLEERRATPDKEITIGDFLDMGFDPTRLKELTLEGEPYIFERVQVRQLELIEKIEAFLQRLAPMTKGQRVGNALLKTNPPLLAVRDRGNGYVLRKKIPGIHWEEAMEQLQTCPRLRALNSALKAERIMKNTVSAALQKAAGYASDDELPCLEQLACFVPWEITGNQPRLVVEFSSTYLESVWLA